MKPVVSATSMSAVLTLVTLLALRAATATLAVVAVASAVALLAWYAQLWSTEDEPGLDLLHPTGAVTLAVVRRRSWATVLPLVTGQIVGAILVGLAIGALDDRLPQPLAYDADALVVAGLGGAVVGLVTAWAVLAVDGGGHPTLAAVPVAVAGALPVALVAVASPAVVLGAAAAGLIAWSAAGVAAAAATVAAAVGSVVVGALVPDGE